MLGLENTAHLVAPERAELIEVEEPVSMSDEERPGLSLTQRGVDRQVVRAWMSDEDMGGPGTARYRSRTEVTRCVKGRPGPGRRLRLGPRTLAPLFG